MAIDTNIFTQFASMEYFFYYGENTIELANECKSDLISLLVQPKRSMFFNRSAGAGIKDFENFPIGLMMQIGIPYAVASAIANRNAYVSDGTNSKFPDRRIATAQNVVSFSSDDNGNVDLGIQYIIYDELKNQNDQNKATNINLSTAGLK